jgi:hypothetical protein
MLSLKQTLNLKTTTTRLRRLKICRNLVVSRNT